ncbi:MAG: acyl-CoA dehydrogenase [Alphaproteobacteria bacterium]|nr:acyl-CoA dehydrogenase [Alphaproteobacteria bacterium]
MIRDQKALDQLLDTLARFVGERLIPLEAQVAHDEAVPDAIVDEMRGLGLFGLSIPEAYGGLELTMEEECLAVLVLGRTSAAFRGVFGTNVGIGSQGLLVDGTEEQKRRYLPKLATGEIIGSFALTEPDAGSDAGSLKTTAKRDGNGYVINGTKRFITNAPRADLFTLFARTNPCEPGAKGVSAFLVAAPTPGLRLGPIDRKMGQAGTVTSDVILEDCRVPADALLGGKEGLGFKTAMKVLDRGRLHIAAACTGTAERLIADALSYATTRQQFGKPIAEHQLVQAMLADCRTEAFAARCMVLETARAKDEGKDVATDASCCKYFASEMVGRVADRALQIHGGNGYMAAYAVERFYRDVRLYRIYEGTSQIQQLVIARNMIRGIAP